MKRKSTSFHILYGEISIGLQGDHEKFVALTLLFYPVRIINRFMLFIIDKLTYDVII